MRIFTDPGYLTTHITLPTPEIFKTVNLSLSKIAILGSCRNRLRLSIRSPPIPSDYQDSDPRTTIFIVERETNFFNSRSFVKIHQLLD